MNDVWSHACGIIKQCARRVPRQWLADYISWDGNPPEQIAAFVACVYDHPESLADGRHMSLMRVAGCSVANFEKAMLRRPSQQLEIDAWGAVFLCTIGIACSIQEEEIDVSIDLVSLMSTFVSARNDLDMRESFSQLRQAVERRIENIRRSRSDE